jgi:hypothetical protein
MSSRQAQILPGNFEGDHGRVQVGAPSRITGLRIGSGSERLLHVVRL